MDNLANDYYDIENPFWDQHSSQLSAFQAQLIHFIKQNSTQNQIYARHNLAVLYLFQMKPRAALDTLVPYLKAHLSLYSPASYYTMTCCYIQSQQFSDAWSILGLFHNFQLSDSPDISTCLVLYLAGVIYMSQGSLDSAQKVFSFLQKRLYPKMFRKSGFFLSICTTLKSQNLKNTSLLDYFRLLDHYCDKNNPYSVIIDDPPVLYPSLISNAHATLELQNQISEFLKYQDSQNGSSIQLNNLPITPLENSSSNQKSSVLTSLYGIHNKKSFLYSFYQFWLSLIPQPWKSKINIFFKNNVFPLFQRIKLAQFFKLAVIIFGGIVGFRLFWTFIQIYVQSSLSRPNQSNSNTGNYEFNNPSNRNEMDSYAAYRNVRTKKKKKRHHHPTGQAVQHTSPQTTSQHLITGSPHPSSHLNPSGLNQTFPALQNQNTRSSRRTKKYHQSVMKKRRESDQKLNSWYNQMFDNSRG